VQVEPGRREHEEYDLSVLTRLERSIDDPPMTNEDGDEDATAVGTDELNLRSIEDETWRRLIP